MKKTFLLSCLMLAAMPVMAAYTGHVYVMWFKRLPTVVLLYPVMSVNVLFSLPLLRGIKHLTVIIIK